MGIIASGDASMQKGRIERRGNCWLLRYYEPILENGRVLKRARAKKLATYSKQYRYEEDVRPLADLILAPINARTAPVESRQDVATFLEHVYLPHVKESKRPATYSAYLSMWRMVKPHLNGLQLRAARTSDVDDLMKAATGDKKRAHTTHRNLRNFLSGSFRFAIRRNMAASNPVRDAEIPRGLPSAKKERYTLEEIQAMIAALPEPARTIVIVAGLTGLRLSEIKGLKWEDFRGDELDVQRSVWSGYVSDTKTLTSKAAVPVLPIVRTALDAHKKRTPDTDYIFAGSTGNPLRLENVLRRDMKPVLEEKQIPWRGWHAFRRGLGTNLNALGADPKTIQSILRHSQLSTTMDIYVQPVAKKSHAAMKKLEKAFSKSKNPASRSK
jgi:integrase